MRKFPFMILCFMFITLLSGCGEKNEVVPQENKFIHIATGGTAGTYYPIGGAIAEILNQEGIHANAQSTGASVANINMLKEGMAELAIVQNDIAFYATNGIEMFKENKVDELRAITSLYPETCQLVTLESKGINNVADLKGKKVAVGPRYSGGEANARQILQAYGITYDDIEVHYLSFGESAVAIKNNSIDAAFVTAGYPTAAIQDIASKHQIKLISLDEDKVNELIKQYPFYTKTIIPSNTYSGINNETTTISVMSMLITTDKMSLEDGEKITKALFDHLDILRASHPAAESISKENANVGMSIKLNGGSENYFKK